MSDLTEARVKAISEGLARAVCETCLFSDNASAPVAEVGQVIANAWVRQAVIALEEFSRPGILSDTARDALVVFDHLLPVVTVDEGRGPETAPESEAQDAARSG